MDDFRLKVFVSAAKNLNFSKCAEEMNISQPAVSKHINELENGFGVSLFNRSYNGVSLTRAGEILLTHAEKLLQGYRELEYEMGLMANAVKGNLRIGASTTAAQYLMPRILAGFIGRFDGVTVSMKSGNSENIEKWLSDGAIDLGIVENTTRKAGLHYEHLLSDELVLTVKPDGRFRNLESITAEQLKGLPMALRENGSGTREIIAAYLSGQGIGIQDLDIIIELDSTEAIKSFIMESDCAAIVSVIAIRDEIRDGKLKIVDIGDMEMEREFASVFRPGEMSGLREKFHQFAKHFARD